MQKENKIELYCDDCSDRTNYPDPTPELIHELVRDNARHGDGMTLYGRDSCVQITGDFDAAHPDASVFSLQYCEDADEKHFYQSEDKISAADAEQILVSELREDHSWRDKHVWSKETNEPNFWSIIIAIVLFLCVVIGIVAICKFVVGLF